MIFDDITVSVFGLKLLTQKFKNVKRFWVMTYLDGDLRYVLNNIRDYIFWHDLSRVERITSLVWSQSDYRWFPLNASEVMLSG